MVCTTFTAYKINLVTKLRTDASGVVNNETRERSLLLKSALEENHQEFCQGTKNEWVKQGVVQSMRFEIWSAKFDFTSLFDFTSSFRRNLTRRLGVN